MQLGLMTTAVVRGMGNYASNLSANQQDEALKYSWFAQGIAIMIVPWARVGVIVKILQLQQRSPQREYRYGRIFLIGLGISNVVLGFCEGMFALLGCWPTAKLWNKTVQGTCHTAEWNFNVCVATQAYFSFTDLVLTIYPSIVVFRTKMSLAKRIRVSCLMGFSVIPTVCAAVKGYYTTVVGDPTDETYKYAPFLIWTITESWIIIIITCIPPLTRPTCEYVDSVAQQFRLHALKSQTETRDPSPSGTRVIQDISIKRTGS